MQYSCAGWLWLICLSVSLTGTRGADCWPVAGAGRLWVDNGSSNVCELVRVGGLGETVLHIQPGAAWHLLASGDYAIAGNVISVVDGGSYGATVLSSGGAVVWVATADSTIFWLGFSAMFTFAVVGLGARWVGRLTIGHFGHGCNE